VQLGTAILSAGNVVKYGQDASYDRSIAATLSIQHDPQAVEFEAAADQAYDDRNLSGIVAGLSLFSSTLMGAVVYRRSREGLQQELNDIPEQPPLIAQP